MGDLKQALYWQKQTRAVIDSIQSSEARSQTNEFDAELSLTYAENDVKEMKLARDHVMLTAGGVVAALIIAFLVLYGYRSNKHNKHMKATNSKLQEAYDQLEETTKAKERIESELRIAREIQSLRRRWVATSTAMLLSTTCSTSAWATSAARVCLQPSSWLR